MFSDTREVSLPWEFSAYFVAVDDLLLWIRHGRHSGPDGDSYWAELTIHGCAEERALVEAPTWQQLESLLEAAKPVFARSVQLRRRSSSSSEPRGASSLSMADATAW